METAPAAMKASRGRAALFALPLATATAALVWIVPDLPFRHLDDPSHWGVIGYLATLLLIAWSTIQGTEEAREHVRRSLVVFLVAMPLVYLANWLRFGGSPGWLAAELVGLALYGAVAWRAAAGRPWLLAAGIGGHALWDAFHYGRAPFVPDWYVVGCVVIDVGVGIWAAGQVAAWRRRRRA